MTDTERSTHTPGPWFHSCDHGNRYCNVNAAVDADCDEFKIVFDLEPPLGMSDEEHEANARLIASAPKLAADNAALLAALEATTAWLTAMQGEVPATGAVAVAMTIMLDTQPQGFALNHARAAIAQARDGAGDA